MRRTLSLDPDVGLLGDQAMREQGLSFDEAVNRAIRRGLGEASSSVRKYTRPRKLGPARADLRQARQLAAALEDDAIARRLAETR